MNHEVPINHVVAVQEARIAVLVRENTMLEALVNHLTGLLNTANAEIERMKNEE